MEFLKSFLHVVRCGFSISTLKCLEVVCDRVFDSCGNIVKESVVKQVRLQCLCCSKADIRNH